MQRSDTASTAGTAAHSSAPEALLQGGKLEAGGWLLAVRLAWCHPGPILPRLLSCQAAAGAGDAWGASRACTHTYTKRQAGSRERHCARKAVASIQRTKRVQALRPDPAPPFRTCWLQLVRRLHLGRPVQRLRRQRHRVRQHQGADSVMVCPRHHQHHALSRQVAAQRRQGGGIACDGTQSGTRETAKGKTRWSCAPSRLPAGGQAGGRAGGQAPAALLTCARRPWFLPPWHPAPAHAQNQAPGRQAPR